MFTRTPFFVLCLIVSFSTLSAHAAISLGQADDNAIIVNITPETNELGSSAKIWMGAMYGGQLYVRGLGSTSTQAWTRYSSGPYEVAQNLVSLPASFSARVVDFDASSLSGLDLYVGYGTTEADLSKPGHLTKVYTIPAVTVNTATSYTLQNTPDLTDIGGLLTSKGYFGYYYDARQAVDMDGDGVKEIVVAPGLDLTTGAPIKIFKKQDDGSYAEVSANVFSGAVPTQVHPRKVIAADFNGDGIRDLYFVDHGYDHTPFPGAANVLALSDRATGKLAIKSIPSDPVAFHHCASAGDIDRNGRIDIFVCAEAWQGIDKSPYFLINDGKGNFQMSRAGVPASLVKAGTGMLSAELIDIDGDGVLDLIVGVRHAVNATSQYSTVIFWGDGTGAYNDERSLTLPAHAVFNATYDIKAEPLSGSGLRDLVLLNVRPDLSGYYFQIFRQSSPRSFVDESLARIIKNESTWEGLTGTWMPWIHMFDISNDGIRDLVIGDSSSNIPARNLKWINNGQGYFTKAP
jgi:hypothetical protein